MRQRKATETGGERVDIIVTHENADFDAVAAMLAAYKLHPGSLPVLPERLNQNVARFLTLYQNGLPFLPQQDFRAGGAQRLIVVDTQRPVRLRGLSLDLPTHFIDHHPLSRDLPEHATFSGETTGAATTLLVEQLRERRIRISPLEATLLMLGIYEDTGSLTYGTTTSRDLNAAAWLLDQGAALDTVRRFLAHPLSDEQQALLETLLRACDSRSIEGFIVAVAAAQVETYIAEINTVAHRLRDMLDPAALFVTVQMPGSIQLVCRSTVDALDVGEIARRFGGGGHSRAAAATIYDLTLPEVVSQVWQEAAARIQPITRVAELMSYGAQTVEARQRVDDVIHQIRRIGHEGYPVVEAGRVVGLLTRRDADRAAEHGLGHLTVREIMTSGTVTVRPEDSVLLLEQRMVESGWGQIPVVDEHERLLGIVTRTDLIKHWAQVHPPATTPEQTVSAFQIETVLGRAAASLISAVADQAQMTGVHLYLVGGIVRDLLLYRRNLDIDFVVEGDAIALAHALQGRFGGRVSSFRPFGTAKWRLTEETAAHFGAEPRLLPDHVDFATARNEFYEHPTALPTVYNSSIKLDLQRRDFTINTLAVQLSPSANMGRILDHYGGLNDLRAGLIRALHSLSFVDDPTRILRAVRFEQRLGFQIEPRTDELIASALPMLGRITGERLRNELTLLLREIEPERGLLSLQQRGALAAIHPDFRISESLVTAFQAVRDQVELPWPMPDFDQTILYWHVLAAHLGEARLAGVVARLMFGRRMAQSLAGAARLTAQAVSLAGLSQRPSQVVNNLSAFTPMALLTAWLLSEDRILRDRLQRYVLEWQHIQPAINGHRLRERGLKPGPCYTAILSRLRAARLDGEVTDEAGEERLLQTILDQERACHDRA